jgi:hypothetical protein
MNTNKKFDPTKPCQTRGGDPVKILTTDAYGNLPIYFQNERTKVVSASFANGRAFEGMYCMEDIINIPQKLVGWVNIYKGDVDTGFYIKTYATEAKARSFSDDPDYIETRKIEVEVP